MTEPRYCTHGDEGTLVYRGGYEPSNLAHLWICCYECRERLRLPTTWFCFPIEYQKTVANGVIAGKGIQLRY